MVSSHAILLLWPLYDNLSDFYVSCTFNTTWFYHVRIIFSKTFFSINSFLLTWNPENDLICFLHGYAIDHILHFLCSTGHTEYWLCSQGFLPLPLIVVLIMWPFAEPSKKMCHRAGYHSTDDNWEAKWRKSKVTYVGLLYPFHVCLISPGLYSCVTCAYHDCKLFFKWLTRSVPLQDVKLQPLPHLSDKNRPRELLQVIGKFVVCTESPLSIYAQLQPCLIINFSRFLWKMKRCLSKWYYWCQGFILLITL